MRSTSIQLVDRSVERCPRCGERLPMEVVGRTDLGGCGVARNHVGEGVRVWPADQLGREDLVRSGYQLCQTSEETA